LNSKGRPQAAQWGLAIKRSRGQQLWQRAPSASVAAPQRRHWGGNKAFKAPCQSGPTADFSAGETVSIIDLGMVFGIVLDA
jgi:hypothetical protein